MFIHAGSDEAMRQSRPLDSQCSLRLKFPETLAFDKHDEQCCLQPDRYPLPQAFKEEQGLTVFRFSSPLQPHISPHP